MGSFMLPGMGSPEQPSCSRVVRFDNECVLIPKTNRTRSKMPVVLTKSYSLPLWKRRTHQFSDSDVEDPAGSLAQPQSSEDNRVTIKVPIPTFANSSTLFCFHLNSLFQVQKKVLRFSNSKVSIYSFFSNYTEIATFMSCSSCIFRVGFKLRQTQPYPSALVTNLPSPPG